MPLKQNAVRSHNEVFPSVSVLYCLPFPDTNEDATRKRQRRLMVQKEQAERSRQRLEQKVKENELRQQLAAKKDRQESTCLQTVTVVSNSHVQRSYLTVMSTPIMSNGHVQRSCPTVTSNGHVQRLCLTVIPNSHVQRSCPTIRSSARTPPSFKRACHCPSLGE